LSRSAKFVVRGFSLVPGHCTTLKGRTTKPLDLMLWNWDFGLALYLLFGLCHLSLFSGVCPPHDTSLY